jgi:hypothetical protein
MAATSNYDLIDCDGRLIKSNATDPIRVESALFQRQFINYSGSSYNVIQGSTVSYRREIIEFPRPPWRILCSEDNLMNFQIYGNGLAVSKISSPLVKYREHEDAIANKPKRLIAGKQEARPSSLHSSDFRRTCIRQINLMRTLRWMKLRAGSGSHLNEKMIKKHAAAVARNYWWARRNFFGRVQSILADIVTLRIRLCAWKALRVTGGPYGYQPLATIYSIIEWWRRCRRIH